MTTVGDWSVACPLCGCDLPVPVAMRMEPTEPGATHATAILTADTRTFAEHVEVCPR